MNNAAQIIQSAIESPQIDTHVIISIPFQRLIRSHLSPLLIEMINQKAKVVVVSPFAGLTEFMQDYGHLNIDHIIGPSEKDISWISRKLIAVSSILRMQGYWLKRRHDIPYYWANRHVKFGREDGIYKMPFIYRLISDLLAMIGLWSRAWHLFDDMHARWSYKYSHLATLSNCNGNVVLIQASSWGFQDAVLAWLARKKKWRTIFLPYTTDQLFCNGYLYSDFDAVCVQGENEYRWAKKFHHLSDDRIVRLGSIYMRVLNSIISNRSHGTCYAGDKKRIVYAGLISSYFPEECEIEAVNKLSNFMIEKLGEDWELIYRPARFSEKDSENIAKKLAHPNKVVVSIPSPTSLGMERYSSSNPKKDLENIVNLFCNVEILVTSLTTTLSLEAAKLGVPSICYFPENNSFLRSLNTDLLFNQLKRPIIIESIPVARNLIELVDIVYNVLLCNDLRQEITASIIREWDYPDSDFTRLLEMTVFN